MTKFRIVWLRDYFPSRSRTLKLVIQHRPFFLGAIHTCGSENHIVENGLRLSVNETSMSYEQSRLTVVGTLRIGPGLM